MKNSSQDEKLMITIAATVGKRKKNNRKNLLQRSLFEISILQEKIKLSHGKLQKIFKIIEIRLIGTLEFNCICNHKTNDKYERFDTTCNYLLFSTGVTFTDLRYILEK